MKLPLSWLKEFVAVAVGVDELARRLALAGLEVENVERHRPGFSGVVVARVTDVRRHPNADRLTLCEVEADGAQRLTVVCGAPNVRAGMKAALARVGARLCAASSKSQGESAGEAAQSAPLEGAVIRGVKSEGMLCSERELGLSTEHQGILELPADAPVGADLADYLNLDDVVLDIAVTPNRGDCLSILGLAREVGALFGLKVKPPRAKPLSAPRFAESVGLSVEILAPELCPRYAARMMRRVKVGPSPAWLRRRLELCGMRPVSNVVDVTNYVMLELGQPLHAFDLAQIAGGRIVVRRADQAPGGRADAEFVTLDGESRALAATDLLITDAEKPLAIAGVMGGRNSEVDESTRDIVLESAYFEPMTVARTARRLGLKSEASYRFERGVDRKGQVLAVERAARLIAKVAGARPASAVIDVEPAPPPEREITLEPGALESILGVSISPVEVARRLSSLGARVRRAPGRRLRVVPPSFRPDLSETADLAEEVARLGGFEEVPASLPERSFAPAAPDGGRAVVRGTREVMVGCGLTEVKTLAFTAPGENARFPGLGTGRPVRVKNPLSAEFSELRLSLLPGLLAALRFNLNREAAAFHAFEVAKVFAADGAVAGEGERIAGISFGDFLLAAIGKSPVRAGFETLKGVLQAWFAALGCAERVEFARADPSRAPYLHPGRAAEVSLDGAALGVVGELNPAEAMRLELPAPCALFELDFGRVITYGFTPRRATVPPPRFPAVRRDLALVLDRDFPAANIIKTISQIKPPLLESVEVFDVYEGGQVAAGKKSVALACRYRARERTLTDEEVNRAHAWLVEQARARLGAELRQ